MAQPPLHCPPTLKGGGGANYGTSLKIFLKDFEKRSVMAILTPFSKAALELHFNKVDKFRHMFLLKCLQIKHDTLAANVFMEFFSLSFSLVCVI